MLNVEISSAGRSFKKNILFMVLGNAAKTSATLPSWSLSLCEMINASMVLTCSNNLTVWFEPRGPQSITIARPPPSKITFELPWPTSKNQHSQLDKFRDPLHCFIKSVHHVPSVGSRSASGRLPQYSFISLSVGIRKLIRLIDSISSSL